MSIVLGHEQLRQVARFASSRSRGAPDRHDLTRPHGRRRARGRLRRRPRRGRQHRPARHRHDAQHGLRARAGPRSDVDRHRALRHAARRALPRRRAAGHAARACSIAEHPWSRLRSAGRRTRTPSSAGAAATASRPWPATAAGRSIEAGIEGLVVLKTTGSGWEGYHRDAATRRSPRPTTGSWRRASPRAGPTAPRRDDRLRPASWEAVRDGRSSRLLRPLQPVGPVHPAPHGRRGAGGPARGASGSRSRCPTSTTCCSTSARFGLENDNEIFHATTEPYGLIEGTVERAPVAGSAARVSGRRCRAPTPPPARSSAASAR